jgi:hypothetical protein
MARIQHFKKRNASYMIYKKYGYTYSITEPVAVLSIKNSLGSLSIATGKSNIVDEMTSIGGEPLVTISGSELVSIN